MPVFLWMTALNAGTRTSEELSSCVGDPTQPGMATMLVPATALKPWIPVFPRSAW